MNAADHQNAIWKERPARITASTAMRAVTDRDKRSTAEIVVEGIVGNEVPSPGIVGCGALGELLAPPGWKSYLKYEIAFEV